MKKSVLVTIGVVAAVPPVLLEVLEINSNKRVDNNLKVTIDQNVSIGDFNNPFIEIENNKEALNEPKGIIGNVTHYTQRSDKKETIDIFLDSQTVDKADSCFLMVSVYNSLGELEYRLDTTTVKYNGSTHYEIELDEPLVENEIERKVCVSATFYSNKEEKHQYLEYFANYEMEEVTYEFNDNIDYKSNYPIAVKYTRDGKKEKIFENFSFNSLCDINFEKPIFDLSKLYFKYNYANNLDEIPLYDECYLLIDDVYDLSDINEENSMKKIPLKLSKDNGIIKFDLVYSYFYDSNDGMIYEKNETGRRKISKLFLPTTYENEKESIYYEIHLNNLGAGLNNYVFKSYASFDIKWFGSCGSSFFCVQSGDELINGAYYSGGVRI